MIRIFVDTNVWFSAFYGSTASEKIVTAHIQGLIKAVISQQVLDELVKNIATKIPPALSPLKTFLETTPPEIIPNPSTIPQLVQNLAHPKDLPILASAHQAKVKYFITGNTKHFNLQQIKTKTGIYILSPAQAAHQFNLP